MCHKNDEPVHASQSTKIAIAWCSTGKPWVPDRLKLKCDSGLYKLFNQPAKNLTTGTFTGKKQFAKNTTFQAWRALSETSLETYEWHQGVDSASSFKVTQSLHPRGITDDQEQLGDFRDYDVRALIKASRWCPTMVMRNSTSTINNTSCFVSNELRLLIIRQRPPVPPLHPAILPLILVLFPAPHKHTVSLPLLHIIFKYHHTQLSITTVALPKNRLSVLL